MMIDLSDVRARVRLIDAPMVPGVAGFISVSDWSSATDAINNGDAVPPACYVSLSAETPEKNRRAAGGRAQLVRSRISTLFCLPSQRADDERADPIEIARGALIAKLVGFKPGGALAGFDYAGYSLRAEGDGLVWGEVLFAGAWDLISNT
jgi:hypothetical protein